ncbi:hypothetical protein OAL09_05310 [Verrucomicrobia bacterium]|nr:hypothetical protein [Verrucomicrobiota bacterium]
MKQLILILFSLVSLSYGCAAQDNATEKKSENKVSDEEFNKVVNKLKKEITDLKIELNPKRKQLDKLAEDNKTITEEIRDLKFSKDESDKKSNKEIENLKGEKNTLIEKLKDQGDQIAEFKTNEGKTNKEIENLKTENNGLKINLVDEKKEAQAIKEDLKNQLSQIKANSDKSSFSPLLLILAVACACVSCALAIFSFGLLNLKLKSRGGKVVTLEGNLSEYREHIGILTDNLKDLQQKTHAYATNISQPIEDVKHKYDFHDASLTKQTERLNQIAEMISSFKAIAQEKKNELEDYKKGYMNAQHNKILLELCSSRDKIEKIRNKARKEGDSTDLMKLIDAVDQDMKDRLEMDWDIVEIDLQKGSTYDRNDKNSNEIDLLHPMDTNDIGRDNTIAEIPQKGYRIQIHNGSSTPEDKPFRRAQIVIFKHQA